MYNSDGAIDYYRLFKVYNSDGAIDYFRLFKVYNSDGAIDYFRLFKVYSSDGAIDYVDALNVNDINANPFPSRFERRTEKAITATRSLFQLQLGVAWG